MKKFVIATLMAAMCCTPVFAGDATVRVGEESFDCIIRQERTYIPMRQVFEALDYTVGWIPEEKAVAFIKDGRGVLLWTGDSTVTGYGVLENKVIVEEGRTWLPLRELLNILGYQVEWNGDTKTAGVVLPGATTEANTETTTEATTEAVTEATTETTTEVTTEATTEITTEAEADHIFEEKNIEVNGKPVRNQEELLREIIANVQSGVTPQLSVEELMSLIPEK